MKLGGVPSLLGEVDDDARMRSIDEDRRLKVSLCAIFATLQ
jgi:hypothetical protein